MDFELRLSYGYVALYYNNGIVVESNYKEEELTPKKALLKELEHHINILKQPFNDSIAGSYEPDLNEFKRMKKEFLPICKAGKSFLIKIKL